jgi:MFS superfamily sulfate permease-like transporter
VVLDAGANQALDVTSGETLEELVTTRRRAGIGFALADVRQPVVAMARRTGLLAAMGDDSVFHAIDEAVTTVAASSL